MLIIHAADIHLDSPLAGLASRAGERASDLVGATRRAFTALVDHTIDVEASLLLIAGDLYDGDWKDFSTGLFFVSEMARLDRAGIRVGAIKGNHDAENQMTRSLTWLGNVKVFRADRAETWVLEDLGVAVHGRSFPTEAEGELRRLGDREGAGSAAQESNDAAAEMVDHVERWLRLRAANIILNRAVERYRERNQHPLVQRASEIFAAVAATGANPIVRLSVDYTDAETPVLVGYRADGKMCPVKGMSDGTLDHLYLALRIAAIERHMESAEPLSFVADDLFITSDEDRTAAGIRTLAELGRHTQVLLFTHHRYVVEAAQAHLKPLEVRLHTLGGISFETAVGGRLS